jgi:alcohol dehydrogenase class IV
MKPEVILGVNSIQELAEIYPHYRFHIWHIPEIDDFLITTIKKCLGDRVASQNVYDLGMPDLETVAKAQAQFSQHISESNQSVILAVGGGSLMDFAKVLRFWTIVPNWLYNNINTPVNEIPKNCIKQHLILMPTTSGTGSEVTGTATIWDFNNNKKHSFFGTQIYADYAIVDPQLTVNAPWELTRDSALDALSHALESIWNRNATMETRQLAIEASKKICLNLQGIKIDSRSMSARLALSHAALLAGQAMAKTQTALAHALSYEDTLNKNISHGYACATWLPVVWQLIINSTSNESHKQYIKEAIGDFFESPTDMFIWLKDLGVEAYDPKNITDEILKRIELVRYSPRGKNFLGFDS